MRNRTFRATSPIRPLSVLSPMSPPMGERDPAAYPIQSDRFPLAEGHCRGGRCVSSRRGIRWDRILCLLRMSAVKTSPAQTVRDVLNQAFDLSLTIEDCRQAAQAITDLLRE
jgi:hypothetical protein